MNDLLKVVSCCFFLNFGGIIGMQVEPSTSIQNLMSFQTRTNMGTIVVQGSVLLPVSETPTLYLVSKKEIESFSISKSVDMFALKSFLRRSGIEQMPSALLEPHNDTSMGEYIMPIQTNTVLPKAISSAVGFFTGRITDIPTEEKALFFLRSLLRLGKANDSTMNIVEDALSEYDSYYEPDPYFESSKRLHNIGIYEYLKLFTEECFSDLQIVLEFSKLTKIQNADCKRDFEIFLRAITVIIETVKEDRSNSELLRKFKCLYERMTQQ